MTGLKIIQGILIILLTTPYIIFLYMGMGKKMKKEMDEIFEKEWEEMKSDS